MKSEALTIDFPLEFSVTQIFVNHFPLTHIHFYSILYCIMFRKKKYNAWFSMILALNPSLMQQSQHILDLKELRSVMSINHSISSFHGVISGTQLCIQQ